MSIFFVILLSCFPKLARHHPTGMILLALFTIAESVVVGFITTLYEAEDVIFAAGVTSVVVIGLTLFACQTKFDFTGLGPYLFVALLVLFAFAIILMFIDQSREVTIIFAILGTLLFSVYLVYDTQLVIGGTHRKYQYSVDDYVFAALSLYLDIVNLFIFLLLLIGGGGGGD